MNQPPPSNKDRFVRLVEQHQAGLRAFVRALGARAEWVDDLAQEALLRAYRQFDQFDESAGDFGKWVRGFARNLLMNELSTHARRGRILHERVSEILLTRHADAVEAHAAAMGGADAERERLAALKLCMGKLPDESRRLIHRRYAEGCNATELARDANTSADALRQTLLRIRRALKLCIERQTQGGESA